ncbi:MAG: tetratricopeptide repeat protein [Candidatus Aureabacteria bacterium]|nr:tetratricopeptide repeat protein [Candidatus Auribacterota bacterium]
MKSTICMLLCAVILTGFHLEAADEGIDFGDMKSVTLTTKAWNALEEKDWKSVEIYTDKCITLYSKEASKQQQTLSDFPVSDSAFTYWALNDVATCHFIAAKALNEQGNPDETRKSCEEVINQYSFSQCWDPSQKIFWKVADACKDLITSLESGVDFGDYTSETFTRKAWEALDANQISHVVIYTEKCMSLYENEAIKQQASLSSYAPKEHAFDYWALNDVGTCYFILGEAYLKNQEWEKAKNCYQKLIDEYGYSQCWDPKGWFWKPAVAARGKLNKIAAEHPDN